MLPDHLNPLRTPDCGSGGPPFKPGRLYHSLQWVGSCSPGLPGRRVTPRVTASRVTTSCSSEKPGNLHEIRLESYAVRWPTKPRPEGALHAHQPMASGGASRF